MRQVFRSIWSFLTNKWVKRIIIIIVLFAVGIGSYQIGSYKTFKDLNQRLSFSTSDETDIKQSDVTENLMSTKSGHKEFANIVNALAMKASLKKDGISISKDRLIDYGQRDVERFKMKHPKGTSTDFENSAVIRYGSDTTYRLRSTMDVARAMYAEKHYNYKSDLDKRLNQLHGLKTYNVTIKQEGSSKDDSFELTPYHYMNLFGEDNLNKYKNVKKGDVVSVSDDNHKYDIKIKDNGKAFTDNDIKQAMKKDTMYFLQVSIQNKMDKQIQKEIKKDKLIEFKHPFDEHAYESGMKK